MSPMPNSPAEMAGIRPGDLLIAVDGVSVEGWSTIEVVQTIRGKKGTEVLLGVIHLGQDKVENVSINRGEIDLTSVFWNMTFDKYAYLNLRYFYSNSDESLIQTIEDISQLGARGIILDLRDNPGGLLTTVVTIASQFLGDGDVVHEVDGHGDRKNWEVECEIDLRLVKNTIVKAASQEEAEEKAREMWERRYASQNPFVEVTACWSDD